jgi:hypothetical protein
VRIGSLAANDTAGKTGASVAGGLGVLVVSLAEIIFVGVHDDGTSDDRVGSFELDDLVSERDVGHALFVCHDVAKVAMVTSVISGTTVSLAYK